MRTYTSDNPALRKGWKAAAEDTATHFGKGGHSALSLRRWTRAFLEDRTQLPTNPYGAWNESLLGEGLQSDILEHIRTLGEHFKAEDVQKFIATPDIQDKYELGGPVHLSTVQRWLYQMNYRFTKQPHGQYVDGHEREDVVAYRQNVYLP
ncbi:hypothetical protein OF83DRAFT_1068142, partial [Amylostereum chailletii]